MVYWVLASGNCKLGSEDGIIKHVYSVSDCVIDLVSSDVVKHFIGNEYGIKCQREHCTRLIYRDHCLELSEMAKMETVIRVLPRMKRFE